MGGVAAYGLEGHDEDGTPVGSDSQQAAGGAVTGGAVTGGVSSGGGSALDAFLDASIDPLAGVRTCGFCIVYCSIALGCVLVCCVGLCVGLLCFIMFCVACVMVGLFVYVC